LRERSVSGRVLRGGERRHHAIHLHAGRAGMAGSQLRAEQWSSDSDAHISQDPRPTAAVPAWGRLRRQGRGGGASANLVQRSQDVYGHSDFGVAEMMGNFQDLVSWVRAGSGDRHSQLGGSV